MSVPDDVEDISRSHYQASERVNVDVFAQNKRPRPQHSHTPFVSSREAGIRGRYKRTFFLRMLTYSALTSEELLRTCLVLRRQCFSESGTASRIQELCEKFRVVAPSAHRSLNFPRRQGHPHRRPLTGAHTTLNGPFTPGREIEARTKRRGEREEREERKRGEIRERRYSENEEREERRERIERREKRENREEREERKKRREKIQKKHRRDMIMKERGQRGEIKKEKRREWKGKREDWRGVEQRRKREREKRETVYVCERNPLVHTVSETSWVAVDQALPSTVTASSHQPAVDISIFVHHCGPGVWGRVAGDEIDSYAGFTMPRRGHPDSQTRQNTFVGMSGLRFCRDDLAPDWLMTKFSSVSGLFCRTVGCSYCDVSEKHTNTLVNITMRQSARGYRGETAAYTADTRPRTPAKWRHCQQHVGKPFANQRLAVAYLPACSSPANREPSTTTQQLVRPGFKKVGSDREWVISRDIVAVARTCRQPCTTCWGIIPKSVIGHCIEIKEKSGKLHLPPPPNTCVGGSPSSSPTEHLRTQKKGLVELGPRLAGLTGGLSELRRDVQGVLTSGLCVLCGLERETSSARREIQLLQPNGWYKGPHKGPSTPPALSFGNDERVELGDFQRLLITSAAGTQGLRESGDPRENPLTSGIVRHDSRLRRSGRDPGGDRTRRASVGGEQANRSATSATNTEEERSVFREL
ncbi:hypothetical protein PR048_031223 [Dryococelus australis]|uniref:Uncharacterized protein n=1 Tax=Dryococelus australis TaxID=614101 RepID=A0ABQ9G5S2_9NEOP|nr:hypothetical protein PR048_031223 [Dryococelus australis]